MSQYVVIIRPQHSGHMHFSRKKFPKPQTNSHFQLEVALSEGVGKNASTSSEGAMFAKCAFERPCDVKLN